MKRVVIALLLSFMLVFNAPVKSYASAGTLVVQGGTIATGGLAAGALAGLAGPAVVIVFASMMAMGIDIELTQQSQAAGMTKTEFVKNKIQSYCNEANITAGVFYKGILDGTNVVGDGAIKLSSSAEARLRKFINWLQSTGQISDGSSSGSANNVMIDGNELLYLNDVYLSNSFYDTGMYRQIIAKSYLNDNRTQFTNTAFTYLQIANGNIYGLLLSKEVFYGGIGLQPGSTSQATASSRNGYYYRSYNVSSYIELGLETVPLITTNLTSVNAFISSLTGQFQIVQPSQVDTFTGTNVDTGALSPSGNSSAVVNPGLAGSIPIPADTDVTINVQDYLDALDKLLSGLQDVTVGAIDQATGIPIEMDIPDTLVIDPTISREEDDPIHPQIETPVIDEDDPVNPEVSPNLSSEPLKFDLRNIFPFCIPFDIKDMLGLLSAEPVAPSYHVQWDIPIVNTQLDFTVDLSSFNSVALILRKMEILAFVIGLAIITRNLIRG